MTVAQKQAVQTHRKRLRNRGLVRLEIQASKSDKALIRKVANLLRGDPARAADVRARLQQIVGEEPRSGLKALLASAPLEGVDLSRDRDLGRDVEL
jgi:hypothetical protein